MLRTTALRFARQLGVESELVAARRAIREARQDPTVRRNARDDEHARVVLAAALAFDGRCVDIGANVGGFLETVVRIAPNGQHVAFEPIPALAGALEQQYPSVTVHAMALSDHAGQSLFHVVTSDPGLSGFREGKAAGRHMDDISVEVRALDDMLPRGYAPDVVKIDVEGAELGVLQGATHTLTAYKPIVLLEHSVNLAPQYGTSPEDVFDLLSTCGLRIFDLDGAGPIDRTQFTLLFQAHDRFNWLARS